MADAEDADVADLDALCTAVDGDALDAAFRGRTGGSVTFDYLGYTVTVRDDVVVLHPASRAETDDSMDEPSRTDAHATSFDATSDTACTAVVSAVATVSGAEPMALPPLYAAVDPDALDALVTYGESGTAARPVSVSFVFDGYPVTVASSGIVAVGSPRDSEEASLHGPLERLLPGN